MIEALWDSFKDTLAMAPWLIGIYVALEFIAHRSEDLLTEKISHRVKIAPLLGALFGCIPQCGFTVIAASLYTKHCVSLGTLLAVFISTSDEAIPVILAQKDQSGLVVSILLTKFVIAAVAGYLIDLVYRPKVHQETHAPHDPASCEAAHRHCPCHSHSCREPWWKTFIVYPLKHTLQISVFIFTVSAGISVAIHYFGEERLKHLFLAHSSLQPLIATLIGLIPNCAASVAIAEAYLKHMITFGSAISGLCASAGLGMLVLLKEHKDRKEALRIIGLLILISLIAGFILNFLF